jgi:hypothetical protein
VVACRPCCRLRRPSEGLSSPSALAVTLRSVEPPAEAVALAADRICPYWNAIRGNADVSLMANGHAVEPTSDEFAA